MALRLATLSAHAHWRHLWSAMDSDDIDKVEKILAVHSIANSVNSDGVTPLMYAVRRNRLQLVRALIAHGADVNVVRPDGFTPLLLATFFGYTEIVEALVQQGANVTATTRFGTTAKIWATARGFYDIAEYLQQYEENRGKLELVVAPTTDDIRVDRYQGRDQAFGKPELETEPEGRRAPDGIPPVTVLENDSAPLDKGQEPERSTPELVVRKLKESPEIWDLDHENPSNFKPGLLLVSRITGTKPRALTLAVILILATGGLAALGLRTQRNASTVAEFAAPSRAPLESASDESSVKQTEIKKDTTQNEPTDSVLSPKVIPEVKVDAGEVLENKTSSANSKPIGTDSLTRSSSLNGRSSKIARQAAAGVNNSDLTAGDSVVKSPTDETLTAPEASSIGNTRDTRESTPPKKLSNVYTDPRVIGRPFGTSTTKPKVIQWP